jgi:hypothetical protein
MKKPTKVKLGPLLYKVNFKQLDSDDIAWISFKSSKMEIDNTIPLQHQRQAFLHEISHIILRTRDLSNSEHGAESLGDFLLDFLQENSEVVSWLSERGIK